MGLKAIGAWGALLTVVIIAASALLRLATRFEGAEAFSTLAPAVEQGARIAHRIAASGVGLLAALALYAAYRARPLRRATFAAVATVAGATLVLAVVGRYSAGYGVGAITMLNVAGGTVLACAFWWLREGADVPGGARPAALPLGALAGVVALSFVGAATSFAAMHGERAFGAVHLWLATLLAAFAFAAALYHRRRGLPAAATAVLVAWQYGLGFALLASGRPLALALLHSMLSVLLALSLVSLALRCASVPQDGAAIQAGDGAPVSR